MDKFWYVVIAYSIVWAVVFGYVGLLALRQRQLRQELESLKEAAKGKP